MDSAALLRPFNYNWIYSMKRHQFELEEYFVMPLVDFKSFSLIFLLLFYETSQYAILLAIPYLSINLYMHSSIGSVRAVSYVQSVSQKPFMVSAHDAAFPAVSRSHIGGLAFGGSRVIKREGMVFSCAKVSETTAAVKSDDAQPQGSLKKNLRASFPDGFEALILEVCDETEVAELKLKVGEFEMHLKRNIGATKSLYPVASPTSPLPVRTESTTEASPPSTEPPKSSTEKISPFTNVPVENSAKLAALEASGSSGYELVLSTTVGTFRRGRTLKGNKQPPICHEGDVIKEGQVIGYMDQFGTEHPVKSDKAGHVLKLLFDDGEAVGYGDPLIALMP